MGITGSDVSKQAADMILLDDNFASIVTGVEEGRLIFDNLRKVVAYMVTHMGAELTPFILNLLADIPLGLGPITLLFIDLGTDMAPSIALAYEGAESDIMLKPPRNAQKDRLVTMQLMGIAAGQLALCEGVACLYTYFVVYGENGFFPLRLFGIRAEWENTAITNVLDSYGQEWTYAQRKNLEYTVYGSWFLACVLCQVGNLMSMKTLRTSMFTQGMFNNRVTAALLFEVLFTVFLEYIPGFQIPFKFYPQMWHWWLAPMPFAIAILLYAEFRKMLAHYFSGGVCSKELIF